jgi:hypothetical protein
MAPGQRGARIQAELTRSLNVSAARRRHAHCARLERFLKWQCRLLFLIIFVLFPPIAYFRGFLAVLPLIVFALALLAHTLWLFNRTHRALYRGKDTGRRAHVAEMALMPLAAMRAPDRLRREALGQFHWLAVLSAIAPADEARELAARALRNLEFMPAVDDNGNSSAGWLRREWRQAVWRHIDQLYGDPRKLLVAPARRFPESVSYCPCCCEEYRLPEGICQDCSGVELRAFGEAG